MALLGEWFAGAARGIDDVFLFTLGTGIGGVAMMEGRLLRGKHFQGGCLGGHVPVAFEGGRKCTCGSIGCAEAEASGWSLPLVAKAWQGFEASALAREPKINFEALFRCAKAGDAVAKAVKARCLAVWAAAAVAAIHAYDPELVLFGGGVMASGDEIISAVQSHVDAHAWTPWGKVRVKPAALGNDAALFGAIPLLKEG
jgi:glucokinase